MSRELDPDLVWSHIKELLKTGSVRYEDALAYKYAKLDGETVECEPLIRLGMDTEEKLNAALKRVEDGFRQQFKEFYEE